MSTDPTDDNSSLSLRSKSKDEDTTYMFAGHVAHVAHVHDAALVSDHADSDGVFTHLRRHVLVDLDAQILQHQQT